MTRGQIFALIVLSSTALALTVGCSRTGGSPMDGGAGAGGKGSDARPDAPGDALDSGRDLDSGDGATTPDCSATGTHSTTLGEACRCGSDCTSGFCADGFCCDSACTGRCTSCGLPGSAGTCSPVPSGIKPRSAAECPAQAASLCGHDGTCDGNGGCALYTSGASCGAGTCDTDGVFGGKICDGMAACKVGPAELCWPFGCSAGICRATCATDGDCAAGVSCVSNSCGKLPTGRGPCSSDDACISGHCADGTCCNVACDGACVSCDQTGFPGQCRPVGLGMAHPKCVVASAMSCGMTGVCDGFGTCSLYESDATCIPPTCTGNTANTAGTCDGNGTCQPQGQVKCDPYVCAGGACVTTCTSDSQCVAPNSCTNGSCGQKPNGSSCSAATQCLSNFCVDGFCCESSCDGACRSCGMTGSPGRCVDVAAGKDDPHKQCMDNGASSCGTDGKCDGSGACRHYASGTVCGAEMCTGGAYTPPSTCSSGGQCIPPASQTCYPFACNGSRCFDVCTQATGQCVSPNTCVNGSCGLKTQGASCSGSTECQPAPDGKQYCAQGVCCNSSCSNACQACNLNGTSGSCTSVATGTADSKCKTTDVGTCGTNGTCRSGACDVYHTTNQCKAPSCSGTAASLVASFCDGRGDACPVQGTLQCGAFKCDTTTGLCGVSCDNDNQCVSPNSCVNHSCGKKGNGAVCSSGTECGAGNCVEGVCCNTSCSSATSGVCQSCKVSNHVGTCTPVPSGGTDPGARCKASDRTACGLDGTCNGAGQCHNWDTSTSCRTQSCPAGTTQTNAANCDGKGACAAATTKSCSPYACNVNASTCRTTCTGNSDCGSGVNCNTQTNKCGDKLPQGQVCGVDNDCSSVHCAKALASDATGICCDTSCANGCQSCVLSNKRGTCTNIPAGTGPRDPAANSCPITSNTCGNTGKCDGGGACQTPADGTSCSDSNMCTQLDTCQGGACVGANPITCSAIDQCHSAGTCNTTTGACTTPNVPNGTMCNDGNACTSADACMGGICTGGTAKVCAASDQCHNAGTCNTSTGTCSNPAKSDGTTCSDGNLCTTDTCLAGTCTPGAAKTCTAVDPCHSAGTCDPSTGMCTGGTAKTCTAADKCHSAGMCDLSTGMCTGGTATTCTASDKCHSAGMCDLSTGMCTGGAATTCTASDKCHSAGTCDPSTGTCTGGTAKTCTASECHSAGICDPNTGDCSEPPLLPDGTTCSIGMCCAGTCTTDLTCAATP